MKVIGTHTEMVPRPQRHGGAARSMQGAVRPNSDRGPDRFASAQTMVHFLKKAAAWKMAVQFESESFDPVIKHKS